VKLVDGRVLLVWALGQIHTLYLDPNAATCHLTDRSTSKLGGRIFHVSTTFLASASASHHQWGESHGPGTRLVVVMDVRLGCRFPKK